LRLTFNKESMVFPPSREQNVLVQDNQLGRGNVSIRIAPNLRTSLRMNESLLQEHYGSCYTLSSSGCRWLPKPTALRKRYLYYDSI
ncbi:MAG TPA: hypothetical protein VE422_18890, partial [Terriglobia bacterium]|nr:hypothetical protein [Terriglobia bacterium]